MAEIDKFKTNKRMKKLFLLLFMFAFLANIQFCQVNAQPYKSIFGNNSTGWNISFESADWYGTDSLVAISDTVIDAMNYKIIEQRSPNFNEHQKYYVREDTNSGKYYLRSANDLQKENLFMDLGLNVGDTFVIRNSPFYTGDSLEILVDSVYYINNLKVIKTNYQLNIGSLEYMRFYESIGPNNGLIYLCQAMHYNFVLQCHFKEDTLFFHNPSGRAEVSPCYTFYIVSVPEQEKKAVIKTIYPNPTNSLLNIEFSEMSTGKVLLYNIYGEIVYENKFNNIMSLIEVNVNDFDPGYYFLKFFSNSIEYQVGFVKL